MLETKLKGGTSCAYLLTVGVLTEPAKEVFRFPTDTGRPNLGNHYETLKLQRNCTSKDIRESFIKLSKKNHPDVNKDSKAHKEFLKIQEAYNILSKSPARSNYDLSLSNSYCSNENTTTNVGSTRSRNRYGSRRDPWYEPHFYHYGAGSRAQHEEQSYYGVRGINKVSNGTVAFVVIMIAAASFIGQMIAINAPNARPWDSECKETSVKK